MLRLYCGLKLSLAASITNYEVRADICIKLFKASASYLTNKMPFEKFVKNNLSRHRPCKKYIKATTAF